MVWPNPINREKYVLFILHNSSSKNSKLTLSDLTVINKDYIITNNVDTEIYTIDHGNFNRFWQ